MYKKLLYMIRRVELICMNMNVNDVLF